MDVLGIGPRLQSAPLEPLANTNCPVIFEGVTVPGISWDKSLRAGGTESSITFNLVCMAMWKGVVRQCDHDRMGVQIPDHANPA
eukprot:4964483-Pyramimonas_sp.AAC.1